MLAITATVLLTACADTVIEDGSVASTDVAGTTPPTTTTLPSGTTAELLPQLMGAMSALSQLIIDGGSGDNEALAYIEAVWTAARPQVETEHPQLVAGFDTTVEMAHTAVTRTRPADADKAYLLLVDLVERTGVQSSAE